MFPTMEVNKLKISNCQRVILVHYSDNEEVQFRHYAITQTPAGVSKSVRNILKRDLPELGHLQDISQYLQSAQDGEVGEEGEEGEENTVEAEGHGGPSGGKGKKRNVVKLHEIGPRLELSLVKVEEGVCTGKVLYHAYVKKTQEEEEEQERARTESRELKQKRREAQEENVMRKKKKKAD